MNAFLSFLRLALNRFKNIAIQSYQFYRVAILLVLGPRLNSKKIRQIFYFQKLLIYNSGNTKSGEFG